MQHFADISYDDMHISVHIPLSQINKNIQKAQYALDGMVMDSMVPYMPMVTGSFIALTRARSAAMQGTGQVCAAAPPYGRFLYMGKVMIDPETGSPWARPGAKKVVVENWDIAFNMLAHPEVTAKWFEAAKQTDMPKWEKKVAEEMI